MADIDVAKLAATTNFIHGRLLESEALRSKGEGTGAVAKCLEAAEAACRAMKDVFAPHLDAIAAAASPEEMTDRISTLMIDRAAVASFLNAEEEVLCKAGLDPVLVEAVMTRCADFLDREPAEINVPEIRGAFLSAQFRICQDAPERLKAAGKIDDKGLLRTYRRPILRAAVGVTIIGANYAIFGPGEWFFSVSSGYGANWLATGPLAA